MKYNPDPKQMRKGAEQSRVRGVLVALVSGDISMENAILLLCPPQPQPDPECPQCHGSGTVVTSYREAGSSTYTSEACPAGCLRPANDRE